MTGRFAALGERLERLAERHGPTAFWLRDDDARLPSPALDRLIAVAIDNDLPLALAVIPDGASSALRERLAAVPRVSVLQHGFRHANHAPEGTKKTELGDHRPLAAVWAELAAGKTRLEAFPHWQPVLVPPWNRIGPGVASGLVALGFRGLSLFGERRGDPTAPGLRRFNTHVDLVDWRAGRRFHGPDRTVQLIAERLDRLLSSEADPAEPTGILSHHLVHDAETFAFLSSLAEYLRRRGDCRFPSAQDLLACENNAAAGR